ncbi:MAG: GNAT family N-acetyltransferase [Albidovulum sp.]
MTRTASYPWEAAPTGPAAGLSAAVSAPIPAITTTRLRLRAPRIADFEGYAAITTSARGTYIGGPFTREEAWLDFSQLVAGWLLRGFGLWAVERLADAGLVGFVLLNHEFGDDEPELGFLLLAEAEGQGFGFEAAQAARHFAFGILRWPAVVSYIDAANARAISLAERMGAAVDPDLSDEDLLVYRHIAPGGAA